MYSLTDHDFPFVASHDIEANKFWATEYDNRRRVASAVCQVIISKIFTNKI